MEAVLTEATATARIKQEVIKHGVHRIGDDALQDAGFALALFYSKLLRFLGARTFPFRADTTSINYINQEFYIIKLICV